LNYICKYGLIHDKPCVNNEPSSNNGWVYSAIAESVGMKFSREKLKEVFGKCVEKLEPNFILINRLPEKQEPPISHDEIIGQYLLDMLPYSYLKSNHLVFHGPGRPMNGKTIKGILKGLWRLVLITLFKGKFHRNLFWQYDIEEMNQIAFRLNPFYSYFLKIDNGLKPHAKEKLFWKAHVYKTIKNGSDGEKNILFALASRLDDQSILKKLKPMNSISNYFGDNHHITKQARLFLL